MLNLKAFESVKNKELLGYKSYVNGQFIDSKTYTDVYNPYNGEKIASVTNHSAVETKESIDYAYKSFLSGEIPRLLLELKYFANGLI